MKSKTLASPWLIDFLDKARASNFEVAWSLFLNDALNLLGKGCASISMEDLAFLSEIARQDLEPFPLEGQAALRLMAAMVEDNHCPMEHVRPYIIDALHSDRAGIRNTAAESLWQMADSTSLPALIQAYCVEDHPAVRSTMYHVMVLFSKQEQPDGVIPPDSFEP